MRLREPAAWVALGALVLNLLLALRGAGNLRRLTSERGMGVERSTRKPCALSCPYGLGEPLRASGPHAPCAAAHPHQPRRRNHRRAPWPDIRLVGFGATAPVLAVFAAIVPQAISVIAIGFLIKLVQLQAVPRRLPAGIGLAPYPSDALPPPPVTAAPDQRLQPTWHPDTAAGAAWRTAGDAAAGAPAAGWGADPAVGWQPIPTQPNGQIQTGCSSMGRNLAGRTHGPQFNAYGPMGPADRRIVRVGYRRRPMRVPMPVHRNQRRACPKDPWLTRDNGIRSSNHPSTGGAGRSRKPVRAGPVLYPISGNHLTSRH